ncbi:unnamed protein product [Paramecium sonneborni]|uniref:Uncharacterized protein n=1 Tax=Paramecium sonneborni TaxID=65129 RepID=A0A8S1LEE8_9CILI|nr:unnamed protein product [Paramecium sonneborni]
MQMNDFYVNVKLALFGRKSFGFYSSKKEKLLDSRIDRLIDDTLMPVIKNKISNYKPNQNQDFLDIYIETYLNQKANEPKITELELCQLFVSIVSAGTDTSSHQIAITLYYLGLDRKAQEEIRQELVNVVGDELDIQPQHLNKLALLNAFIYEAFRIKNTVIQPLTRIAKESHFIKNLKIEKGLSHYQFYQVLMYYSLQKQSSIAAYLCAIVVIKLKHGKEVYIFYFPLFGDYFYLKNSFEKYGDATEIFKQRYQKNPDIKFVATNFLNKVFLFIQDPEYYKSVLVNHQSYSKVDILYHPQKFNQIQQIIINFNFIWWARKSQVTKNFIR